MSKGKVHVLSYEKQCWLMFCDEEPTGPHLTIAIAIPIFEFDSKEDWDEDYENITSDFSQRFLVLLNGGTCHLMWADSRAVFFTEKAATEAYESKVERVDGR